MEPDQCQLFCVYIMRAVWTFAGDNGTPMVDNHRTIGQLSRNVMIVMTRSGPSRTAVFREERPYIMTYFACAGHIRKASKSLVVTDTVHSFGRRWFKTFHNKDRIWGAELIEPDVKLISTTAGSRERCGVRSSGSGQRRSRWG